MPIVNDGGGVRTVTVPAEAVALLPAVWLGLLCVSTVRDF